MVDRLEVGGEGAADPLGRRVGGAQAGVTLLQRLQFAHEGVVGRVRDRRGVADVVGELVGLDLLDEVRPPVPCVVGDLLLPHDVDGHPRLRFGPALRLGAGLPALVHVVILPHATDGFPSAATAGCASGVWCGPEYVVSAGLVQGA